MKKFTVEVTFELSDSEFQDCWPEEIKADPSFDISTAWMFDRDEQGDNETVCDWTNNFNFTVKVPEQ